MPATLNDMMPRRDAPRRSAMIALLGIFAAMLTLPVVADAVCSAIPAPLSQGFDAARGIVDRPFASPGDFVTVRIPDGVATPAEDLVVSVIFKPGLAYTGADSPPAASMVVLYGSPNFSAPECAVPTTFVRAKTAAFASDFPDQLPVELAVNHLATGASDVLFRFPTEFCTTPGPTPATRCTDGVCREGTCGQRLCLGGRRDGRPCSAESPCDGGRCIDAPPVGPAAIVITDVHHPLPCAVATATCAQAFEPPTSLDVIGCVDELFSADDARGLTSVHPTFPHFTALPAPNDYGKLASRDARDIAIAVDDHGNLLVPIGWGGILVKDASAAQQKVALPVARLVRFATSVDAFDGRPSQSIRIPDPGFLASFTPTGRRLPPIFEPELDRKTESELVLFGSADERRSVLRIARQDTVCAGGSLDGQRCTSATDCGDTGAQCKPVRTCDGGDFPGRVGCTADPDCCRGGRGCGGVCRLGLFDFGTRLLGGTGPAMISRPQFDAETMGPIPFDGLIQTDRLRAFVVNERLANEDVDKNHLENGTVVVVEDRDTGREQFLTAPEPCSGTGRVPARLVTRVSQPPFSFYALDAADGVVAFLEPEAQPGSTGQDLDCDGDQIDTVLRVFRQNTSDSARNTLDSVVPAIAADHAPLVNGRSLVVANGRVFFRAAESANAPHVTTDTTRVSVDTNGALADAGSRGENMAGNGQAVAYVSDAGNLAPDDADNGASDVFVRTLCLDESCKSTTELVSTGCDGSGTSCDGTSDAPAISDDARFVAFASDETTADGMVRRRVFVRDRLAGTTTPIPGAGDVARPAQVGHVGTAIASTGDRFVVVFTFTHEQPADDEGMYLYDSASSSSPVLISRRGQCAAQPAIAADGSLVAYDRGACTPGLGFGTQPQVYAFDRGCQGSIEDCTELVSGTPDGHPGNLFASGSVVSRDGRFVAFYSLATDLVEGLSGLSAVYVRDRQAMTAARRTAFDRGGIPGFFPAVVKGLSDDGRFIAVGGFFAGEGFSRIHDVVVDREIGLPIAISGASELYTQLGTRTGHRSLSADGRLLAFTLPRGNTNLNPDLFVRDLLSHPVEAGNPADVAADVTGNGVVGDTVLQVVDTTLGNGAPIGPACPAREVAVAGDWAAFLRPEWEGKCGSANAPVGVSAANGRPGDLDENGRLDDEVVQLWHAAPGGPGIVTNLEVAATAVALSTTHIAILVPECSRPGPVTKGCPSGGTDLNGDGDAADTVVWVNTIPPNPDKWVNLHQAADRVDVSGHIVTFTTPESAQGQDLDGDGDTADHVLQVYDLCAPDQPPKVVPQPVTDFVTGGDHRDECTDERSELIAFRTHELDRCNAAVTTSDPNATCTYKGCDLSRCDLNGDGDCCDDVLQVYEVPHDGLEPGPGIPGHKALTLTPCDFQVCDPRVPYKVGKNAVTFLTRECEQGGGTRKGCEDGGTDLNGDGDADDLVLQVFNVRATQGRVNLLGAVSTGFCTQVPSSQAEAQACLDDGDCPAGSSCRLLESRCLYTLGSCTKPDGTTDPGLCAAYGNNAFCSFVDDQEGADAQCLATGRTCDDRNDCTDAVAAKATEITCEKTAQELQRLASPLKAPGGGGETFTSVGRCDNADQACTTNADCPNAAKCDTTKLVVATANDADGDEVPDAFDTCPSTPNPDQDPNAACPAGGSCGDGVVTPPDEICDDGTPAPNDDPNDRCLGCTHLCGPRPRTDCRMASPSDRGAARLVLKQRDAAHASLDFRWPSAPATLSDLGDPLRTTSYAVCLYDGSGGAQPLLEAHALAGRSCAGGACWSGVGNHGFAYRNRTDDGLTALSLVTKRGGLGTLKVHGGGSSVAPRLPFTTPVTVQVVNNETDACWQAALTTPTRNEPKGFAAAAR